MAEVVNQQEKFRDFRSLYRHRMTVLRQVEIEGTGATEEEAKGAALDQAAEQFGTLDYDILNSETVRE
jgi:hypothetical protein